MWWRFGIPDTDIWAQSDREFFYDLPWIPIDGPMPLERPTPYGIWKVTQAGGWYWTILPVPPESVYIQEGILKYGDSLLPVSIEAYVGAASEDDVAQALSEAKSYSDSILSPVATLLSSTAATLTATNSQLASVATQSQSAIKKAEVLTFTLTSNTSSAVPIVGFTQVRAIIPVPTWIGDQVYMPAIASTFTNTSLTATGKRSRGTLLLSTGPMESTSGTFTVIVLGN